MFLGQMYSGSPESWRSIQPDPGLQRLLKFWREKELKFFVFNVIFMLNLDQLKTISIIFLTIKIWILRGGFLFAVFVRYSSLWIWIQIPSTAGVYIFLIFPPLFFLKIIHFYKKLVFAESFLVLWCKIGENENLPFNGQFFTFPISLKIISPIS